MNRINSHWKKIAPKLKYKFSTNVYSNNKTKLGYILLYLTTNIWDYDNSLIKKGK